MRPISIVVLPEDSSSQACEVLQQLVAKMLYLIDPAAPLYDRQRVRLEPSSAGARQAFRGNGWHSLAQRQKRVDVLQYIQSQLKRPDVEGFVVAHVDGDRPYGQSAEGTQSPNQQRFDQLLAAPLRAALKDHPGLLERVVLVVPFYSVEAWLYQNTAVALALYEQHHRSHTHDKQQFKKWQQDPAALDELVKPKEAVAIGDRWNRELASEQFPAQRVYAVGKSFHKSVERLRACKPLVTALQAASAP